MGCGRSKSTVGSTSPSESRHNSDACDTNLLNETYIGDHKEKHIVHSAVFSSSSLDQFYSNSSASNVKEISSSQEEFFRELDERIEQGAELDQITLDKENLKHVRLLLDEWQRVTQSRPFSAVTSASSIANGSATQPFIRRCSTDCWFNNQPADGTTGTTTVDGTPGRVERSAVCRSSRRSSRSLSVSLPAGVSAADVTAPEDAPTDSGVPSGRLLQLGDAFVHDLSASDPDGFVRLNRRPSTYEELPIPEEAGCELTPAVADCSAGNLLRPQPVDHMPG